MYSQAPHLLKLNRSRTPLPATLIFRRGFVQIHQSVQKWKG
ncbi:hypothetical protein NC651_033155 [Populus alba x Populus x berolinensis]|nr:hypothetical protein NC651_033155 [Populus alba x Populus x berolinensis]